MKPLLINTIESELIFVNPAQITMVRLARDNSNNTAIFMIEKDRPIMTVSPLINVAIAWSRALIASSGGLPYIEAK